MRLWHMNPSSSRPYAPVMHLRVWGFVRLAQNESRTALTTGIWAYFYIKYRGTWALRLTLCWSPTAQVRYLRCGFSLFPQLLRCFWKFLPWLQHPEVFSHIFPGKCHSEEKGTERQAQLTWSCPDLHCRAWQARLTHPKLKPGAHSSRAVWAQNQIEMF